MRLILLLTTISLAFPAGENVAFAQAGDQLVTLCFRNRTIQVPFYLVNRYTANGATIGPCPMSTTSWLLDGAGDWFVSGNWSAGVPGAATNAQINNGGTAQIVDAPAAARNVSLGNVFEGSGTLEVLGGAATFNDIDVGLVGTGALTIRNGGQLSIAANGMIGDGLEASGTATVDGPSSKWTNSGELYVGVNGSGALSVTGGGTVSSTNGYIGRVAGSTGAILIDGPGSNWNVNGDLTMGLTGTGSAAFEVRNGGRVSATGTMTVGPLGTVRGDGTIVADVSNAGTIAPGTSPGTLRVNGNFQQSVGGRLQIELAPASFDKLDVSGEITLDNTLFGPPMGGTLEVSLTGGYVPLGTKSFDILDWAGSFSGEFSAIVLPTLGGTLVWDTSQLYINGTLSVTGPALSAGDYNEDGKVDAADYVVWRRGVGTIYTQTDYDVWRANFGQTAGTSAALPFAEPLSVPVPEPSSLSLFGLGLAAVAVCHFLKNR